MRVILIGNQRLIYRLTLQYMSKGYQVSIINPERKECEYLAKNLKALVILGDATDPRILADAEAHSAQLLVALTTHDYINFVCCQIGKHMFGIPETLALINDSDNYQIYKQLGINHIYNQAELVLEELEKGDETEYFHNIASYAGNTLEIFELIIQESMPATGIEIVALGLPRQTVVIGVNRNNKMIFPGRDFILAAGDRLVLAATPEMLSTTVHLVCGEQA